MARKTNCHYKSAEKSLHFAFKDISTFPLSKVLCFSHVRLIATTSYIAYKNVSSISSPAAGLNNSWDITYPFRKIYRYVSKLQHGRSSRFLRCQFLDLVPSHMRIMYAKFHGTCYCKSLIFSCGGSQCCLNKWKKKRARHIAGIQATGLHVCTCLQACIIFACRKSWQSAAKWVMR